MQIRIETPDFIARTLQPADVTQDFAQWFNAPRLLQALKLPRPQLSLERLQALVASFNQAQHFLIGVCHANERPVLGVYHFHVILQHRTATMAFGGDTRQPDVDLLLQQSCGPLCDYFFQHGLVDKISAHLVSNTPEQLQTLNQCGRWVAEATLKQEILAQDGTRLDLAVLSCFKDAPL